MPGFDGTGPWGLGPRTGGGFGFCPPGGGALSAGYAPGAVRGVGRGGIPWGGGRGRAFGGGRGGWRRARFRYMVPMYGAVPPYHAPAPAGEKAFLENEIAYLEEQLAAVKQRLEEMEAASSEE